MASRYRRFIRAPLTHAQLAAFATALSDVGYPSRVVPLARQGFQDQVFGLETPFPAYATTQGDLHWFETGEVHPLDQVVDRLLLHVLEADTTGQAECTCSHCYSHWTDNSDLAGAWAPNPSESCNWTEQHRRGGLKQTPEAA